MKYKNQPDTPVDYVNYCEETKEEVRKFYGEERKSIADTLIQYIDILEQDWKKGELIHSKESDEFGTFVVRILDMMSDHPLHKRLLDIMYYYDLRTKPDRVWYLYAK